MTFGNLALGVLVKLNRGYYGVPYASPLQAAEVTNRKDVIAGVVLYVVRGLLPTSAVLRAKRAVLIFRELSNIAREAR